MAGLTENMYRRSWTGHLGKCVQIWTLLPAPSQIYQPAFAGVHLWTRLTPVNNTGSLLKVQMTA